MQLRNSASAACTSSSRDGFFLELAIWLAYNLQITSHKKVW
jgi:hypothetical protein